MRLKAIDCAKTIAIREQIWTWRHFATILITGTIGLVSFRCTAIEYNNYYGFRLDYPNNWRIKDRAISDRKQVFGTNDVSPLKDAAANVSIYNPESNPGQLVKVVVGGWSKPITAKDVASAEASLRNAFRGNLGDIESRFEHVGQYDAVSSTYTLSLDSKKLRFRQIIIAGKVRYFFITCGAGVDEFDAAEADFGHILSSFRIENEPSPSVSEVWSHSPTLRTSATMLLLTATVAVTSALFKRRRAKRAGRVEGASPG